MRSLRQNRRAGSVLALVLVVGIVLAGLAGVSALLAVSASQANAEWADISTEFVSCESASNLFRAEVVRDYESSRLIPTQWIADLRNGTRFGPAVVREYSTFPGVQVWVDGVSAEGEGELWVEIVAAAGGDATTGRNSQAIRKRISLGNNDLMDFAMLSKTTNCMFCHLSVNGDVGSLEEFKPGWGAQNSGAGSSIHGDVYMTDSAVMGTGSYAGTINGTTLDGDLYENYRGDKLPEDTNGDGMPDFPTIDPDVVAAGASGSIWGGDATNDAADGSGVWVTPLHGTWNPLASKESAPPPGATGSTWKPDTKGALGSVVEGNLTLVGTKDNPIQLDGDIFVRGDVVIKGYVSGRGALYAGRNFYVAGDVVYSNPPDKMDTDVDAVDAIKAGKDELRIAARSNVVIGDWTYQNGDGTLQRFRDRQAQSFMRSSLKLDNVRYYSASDGTNSSTELTRASDGKYYNDLGREVSRSDVVTVDSTDRLRWGGSSGGDVMPDRYDAVMAPGQLQADGSFKSWMTQDDFRSVAGTAEYRDLMYRFPSVSDKGVLDRELGAGWGDRLASMSRNTAWYDHDNRGEPGQGQYVRKDWGTHVVETGDSKLTTVVSRVDAFLYSNKRIAGLTPMVRSLTVNGGLVSGEIQVLAPGVGNHMSWFSQPRYGDLTLPEMAWKDNSGVNEYGDKVDAFYINYDFRLRNGGLGFNLIPGTLGDEIVTTPEIGHFDGGTVSSTGETTILKGKAGWTTYPKSRKVLDG